MIDLYKNERRFIIVQVLKEDVKKNIYQAAVSCFKEKGYEKASMREIAKLAGISAGNLYRYFPNKESLFEYIVEPVVIFLQSKKLPPNHFNMTFLDVNFAEELELLATIINAKMKNHDAIFILFLRNKGTKYENIKQFFTKMTEEHIKEKLMTDFGDDERVVADSLYYKAAAAGVVESMLQILENAKDEKDFIKNIILYVELSIKPVIRHLIDVKENKFQFRRINNEEIYRYFSNSGDSCAHHRSESNQTGE